MPAARPLHRLRPPAEDGGRGSRRSPARGRDGMEPAGDPVEAGEAGGDAGDLLLPLVERLDGLEAFGDQLLDVLEAGGGALLGDGEDAPFALVGELADVAVLLVAELGDGAAGFDQ